MTERAERVDPAPEPRKTERISIVCCACNGRGHYGWVDCERCGTFGRVWVDAR